MTISRARLAGPVTEVAPALLGMRLRTLTAEGPTEVVLTEVEAYGGSDDPASHAYRGPNRRNRSMFEQPGTLYVYRSYGIHWCANVVCGPPGVGQAVLLRAGRPTTGIEIMQRRRRRPDHLCDGPGKLTQALGITGADDGADLLAQKRIRLLPARSGVHVRRYPRVGISVATERAWRFVLEPSNQGLAQS